ncbi:polysaccharide deacetylase family protein [Streptomyces sp. DSM 44915]|uniref:Polysaccharide deacetylase family protein n=1 Tax=Streptomyces chisholmiae TaxID=3075540 RepID=A0ABU2JXQ4_9ACTN|nr:polysaccharide deacetylase family protein [Streptomyces sp. DSM 44915]MDT0269750.1 polysaccharide deacetylase family protein [Streptomyces sp. DSM 44915]
MSRRGVRARGRAAVALAAAVSLLALGGCSMSTVSAAEVRSKPSGDAVVPQDGPDCEELTCIALTFDSAPSEHTPELLEILRAEEVPVTFFLLGRNHIDTYPELVRQMVDEGHELANHTWTHRRLTEIDRDEIHEELARTQAAIAELTGVTPTLMRPPQGRTNDEVGEVSRELGLAQVLWTVTAKDYQTTDSDLIRGRVLEGADRDGIILLHDLYDGTVPAVPGIIEELKGEGYTFVTVSQLFAPGLPEPGRVYR